MMKRRFRKGRRGVVKKAVRKARNSVFRKKVLSVIHKQAENKIAQLTQAYTAVPDAPRTTGVDCFQIVPSVSSSPVSGTFYRLGEKIRLRSLVVKGYFTYDPSFVIGTTNLNNMGLRIMVVQPKANKNLTDIQSNANQFVQNLLQNGSVSQQFSNSVPGSLYYPINKEMLTVYYDKVSYLNQPYIQQVTASGEVVIDTNRLTKHFTIRIPVSNKTLLYDASMGSLGVNSTNFNPVLMFGVVQMDGFANAAIKGHVFYTSHMEYEDL